ncbi:hypothetical protein [Rhizoctonia solani fusarivirus 1]|uniref:Uncharacterized protein n=1 Tax=Rhizoctonia solani fusarivirus 1 TaxID=2599953 RepID=A0AAE6HXG7_9VIRU|nr:hypothetical protein QKQ63_gp2 [Rhizoctonia solani fusarivirus 1]QDW92694.1 hypothetical protein [Rhizoctonia solani fusarivirus 1]
MEELRIPALSGSFIFGDSELCYAGNIERPNDVPIYIKNDDGDYELFPQTLRGPNYVPEDERRESYEIDGTVYPRILLGSFKKFWGQWILPEAVDLEAFHKDIQDVPSMFGLTEDSSDYGCPQPWSDLTIEMLRSYQGFAVTNTNFDGMIITLSFKEKFSFGNIANFMLPMELAACSHMSQADMREYLIRCFRMNCFAPPFFVLAGFKDAIVMDLHSWNYGVFNFAELGPRMFDPSEQRSFDAAAKYYLIDKFVDLGSHFNNNVSFTDVANENFRAHTRIFKRLTELLPHGARVYNYLLNCNIQLATATEFKILVDNYTRLQSLSGVQSWDLVVLNESSAEALLKYKIVIIKDYGSGFWHHFRNSWNLTVATLLFNLYMVAKITISKLIRYFGSYFHTYTFKDKIIQSASASHDLLNMKYKLTASSMYEMIKEAGNSIVRFGFWYIGQYNAKPWTTMFLTNMVSASILLAPFYAVWTVGTVWLINKTLKLCLSTMGVTWDEARYGYIRIFAAFNGGVEPANVTHAI